MQEKSLRTQREEARNRVPHGGGVLHDAHRAHGDALRVLLPARGGSALPADAFVAFCIALCSAHGLTLFALFGHDALCFPRVHLR